MRHLNKIILLPALSVVATAHAAQQGTIGGTSGGESDITLVKQNAVMITDISDLNLGSLNNTNTDLVAFDDICVFNSTANYSVTVTSANSAFELSDGGTGTIPYALTWEDNFGIPNTITYGTPMTGLLGDNSSASCSGGTNARFSVNVQAADFNSAAPGAYTDTLTLMIEPE